MTETVLLIRFTNFLFTNYFLTKPFDNFVSVTWRSTATTVSLHLSIGRPFSAQKAKTDALLSDSSEFGSMSP